MERCGNCNTLSVAKKIIPKYGITVKDVGVVTVENFPMLVCHNPSCRSQWISGEGDQMITDATKRMTNAGQWKGRIMNLYLISQSKVRCYDSYDSAVVAAVTEDVARTIYPGNGEHLPSIRRPSDWCSDPNDVRVKLMGCAVTGTEQGVVLTSYNAGQ